VRTRYNEVTFLSPFTLAGVDGVHAAGRYDIATDEEEIAAPNHLVYRRIATMISLRSGSGAVERHAIDPVDLEAALLRDAGTAV
jgi:hypothetical protein